MKKSTETPKREVVIIGAGPAGLTAGYELTQRGFKVTILESDRVIGGISRTVRHNGFRFDIGGHRFFSKNQDIEAWWKKMLGDEFLDRPRLSRWFYRGNFFHYPIQLIDILKTFGVRESLHIFLSYIRTKLFPIRPGYTLADWCINNFGARLAKPFFLDYNRKLWGIHPSKLSKDFAFQRIRGISFFSVLKDRLKKLFKPGDTSIKSLIKTFRYPKYGPGQMWETVAKKIQNSGGHILTQHIVTQIHHRDGKILSISTQTPSGRKEFLADFVLSTMPLKELVTSLSPAPPQNILCAANELSFRDFITVSLMIDGRIPLQDTWIYTHEESMQSIRVQFFHNWSPFMVPNKNSSCVGFEFTCSLGDPLWKANDKDLVDLAKSYLQKLCGDYSKSVFDAKVIRMKNVYPVYTLGYKEKVEKIKGCLLSTFKDYSLQPIGRGGLHKYNNSDHSMMTAFLAVKNILGEGNYDQWNVNSDAEYHEIANLKTSKKIPKEGN
ncbi:MAG: NAD(P)/FAD-dependent oxidoreductase [Candidatus Moraniibacteriota bacterium]|nr:MAG: NAD(P)/FAD-dependent oxidoreductase [Candidatus Moranbacteria bacterium]